MFITSNLTSTKRATPYEFISAAEQSSSDDCNVSAGNEQIALKNHIKSFDKAKYGQGKEASIIKEELGDFNVTTSEAMKLIKKCFGNSVRLIELKAIINSIKDHLYRKGIELPKLSRNANRSFPLCVKYVQDNLEILCEILPYIWLCDDKKNEIPVHDFE